MYPRNVTLLTCLLLSTTILKNLTGNDSESVSSPKADVLNNAKTGEFIENMNTAKKTKTDLKSLYE